MKVGKRLPPTEPMTPAQAEAIRRRRDETVATLVRAAEGTDAAWEVFSPDAPTSQVEKARAARAEALHQAVQALGAQIKTGRGMVEALNGEPVPEAWVARFQDLHRQRLELRWKADAATFRYPDQEAERVIVASVTDEEVSKALGQEWPSEQVQEAMRAVNAAKELEELKRLCLAALVAAVEQRYGRSE